MADGAKDLESCDREAKREGDQLLPSELHFMRKLKAYEIIQVPNQLTTVTRLPAEPLIFMGNI